MADNFGSSFSNAFAQQQKIGVDERQQQLQAEAQRSVLAEERIKSTLGVAAQITKAAADAGKDPATIAGAIQPLIESAAQVAGTAYGPEGATRVMNMGRALLARPPTGVNGQAITSAPQAPIAAPADVPSGTPMPPGQNLTGPDVTSTSVDYGPVSNSALPAKDDISMIVQAIKSGRQPPVTTGLYRRAAGVKAGLEREGFDLSKANIEWQRAQQQVKSLNSQRMIQYAGLAQSVIRTIDETKRLALEMNNSGIQFLNRAKMEAYAQANGNSETGQLVGRYIAAINTLREEFANLANGGYAPTESAWTLANQQINGNYGVKMLTSSLDEVQRLIRYRVGSIPNLDTLGGGAKNRYMPGATDAPSATTAPPASPPAPTERNFFHGKKFRFEAIPNGG